MKFIFLKVLAIENLTKLRNRKPMVALNNFFINKPKKVKN